MRTHRRVFRAVYAYCWTWGHREESIQGSLCLLLDMRTQRREYSGQFMLTVGHEDTQKSIQGSLCLLLDMRTQRREYSGQFMLTVGHEDTKKRVFRAVYAYCWTWGHREESIQGSLCLLLDMRTQRREYSGQFMLTVGHEDTQKRVFRTVYAYCWTWGHTEESIQGSLCLLLDMRTHRREYSGQFMLTVGHEDTKKRVFRAVYAYCWTWGHREESIQGSLCLLLDMRTQRREYSGQFMLTVGHEDTKKRVFRTVYAYCWTWGHTEESIQGSLCLLLDMRTHRKAVAPINITHSQSNRTANHRLIARNINHASVWRSWYTKKSLIKDSCARRERMVWIPLRVVHRCENTGLRAETQKQETNQIHKI